MSRRRVFPFFQAAFKAKRWRFQYPLIFLLLLSGLLAFQNCSGSFRQRLTNGWNSEGSSDANSSGPRSLTSQNSRFQCAGSAPRVSSIKRLTKNEYIRTLESLFGGNIISDSNLTLYISALPSDLILGREETDSVQNKHFESYLDVGLRIGELLFSSSSIKNSLGISCVGSNTLTNTCLSTLLNQLGKMIFRRPLNINETQLFMDTYSSAPGEASDKFQLLIASLLTSPDFLTHKEDEGLTLKDESSNTYTISDWALASRLSYALWGTMPDAALFQAAQTGNLKTENGLREQYQRMLAEEKTNMHVHQIFSDWLGLETTPALNYSPAFLDGLDTAQLKKDMRLELEDFLDELIWEENGQFIDLMTSDHTKVRSETLSQLYQIVPPTNGKIQFSDGSRIGLLGKAIFLSFVGMEGTSVPIKRGAFLRRQLLCTEISRPPPQSLPNGVLDPILMDPNQTTRAVVHAKTSSTQCIGCHSQINPLGFALEDFDPIGRKRQTERIFDSSGQLINSLPVDSRVTLKIDGKDQDIDGGTELSRAIAFSQEGHDCFTQKFFEANAKRMATSEDTCVLANMVSQLEGDHVSNNPGTIKNMLEALVLPPDIRIRKVGDQ